VVDNDDEFVRPTPTPVQFVELAERVVEVLQRHEIEALVIGGFALVAHNYPRATEDLDLGVNASVPQLKIIRDELEILGYAATLRTPDGTDPLGGVIDVENSEGALVQIVNFDKSPFGGLPRAITDALASAPAGDAKLRIIPLPHLIALKLYAGGQRSISDIRELLRNNPDTDVDAIRELCREYGLNVGGLF